MIQTEQTVCPSITYIWILLLHCVTLCVCSFTCEIHLMQSSIWGRKLPFASVGRPWGTGRMKSVDQRVSWWDNMWWSCDCHVTTMWHYHIAYNLIIHSSINTIECLSSGQGRPQWDQPSGCYLAPSFTRVHTCGLVLLGVYLHRWDKGVAPD